MKKKDVLQKTEEYVTALSTGEGSGHDWWHIHRVRKMALVIGKKERADLFVVELSALLHDIGDWKFHHGDYAIGPRMAKDWLKNLQVEQANINIICLIINELSFKGAYVQTPMSTIEGKIVQDADRLDAIGAIGIARCFAYGGNKQKEIYNPNIKPVMHKTFEEYKNSKGTSINHFYEKLLFLKHRMNTTTGKKIAEGRHCFMEQFLKRFFRECEGKY